MWRTTLMVNMSNNLKLRLSTSFFNRIATFAIAPFMTLYFATSIGVKMASLIAIFQIATAYLSNFIGGYIGDTFDEKKLLLRGQLTHGILQFVLAYELLFKINSWIIVVTYLLSMFIGNIYKSTFSSLLVASVNDENRKFAFTVDYLSVNLALAVGMILGSITFNGLQYIVFIASGTIIVGISIVLNKWYQVEQSESVKSSTSANLLINLKQLVEGYKIPLMDKAFRSFVIGVSLISSVQFALQNSISVNLKEHFTPIIIFNSIKLDGIKMFSWLQIENVIIIVFLTMVVFSIFNVSKIKLNISLAIVIFIASYGLMLATKNWVPLLILGLIGSLAELIIMPEFQAKQSKLIPIDKKSTYVSFNQLGNYLSQLLAAVGLYIYSLLGVNTTMIYTILVGILGLVIIRTVLNTKNDTDK